MGSTPAGAKPEAAQPRGPLLGPARPAGPALLPQKITTPGRGGRGSRPRSRECGSSPPPGAPRRPPPRPHRTVSEARGTGAARPPHDLVQRLLAAPLPPTAAAWPRGPGWNGGHSPHPPEGPAFLNDPSDPVTACSRKFRAGEGGRDTKPLRVRGASAGQPGCRQRAAHGGAFAAVRGPRRLRAHPLCTRGFGERPPMGREAGGSPRPLWRTPPCRDRHGGPPEGERGALEGWGQAESRRGGRGGAVGAPGAVLSTWNRGPPLLPPASPSHSRAQGPRSHARAQAPRARCSRPPPRRAWGLGGTLPAVPSCWGSRPVSRASAEPPPLLTPPAPPSSHLGGLRARGCHFPSAPHRLP